MAGLSAIEVYVLSRRAAGLKQREIAEETGMKRQNVGSFNGAATFQPRKQSLS